MHSVLYTECHAMGVGCGVGGHALKGVGVTMMTMSWGHAGLANQSEGGGWRPVVPGFHPTKC